MNKVIDSVLSIDTFKEECVVFKVMLLSPLLKYHIQTIGIDQYLSKNYIYEHKYLENIKRLYKQVGKRDWHQQYKHILEASMVSTPEGFADTRKI